MFHFISRKRFWMWNRVLQLPDKTNSVNNKWGYLTENIFKDDYIFIELLSKFHHSNFHESPHVLSFNDKVIIHNTFELFSHIALNCLHIYRTFNVAKISPGSASQCTSITHHMYASLHVQRGKSFRKILLF